MHKQMPYEVLVQVFLIQGIRYRPVLKRKFSACHVLLLYQKGEWNLKFHFRTLSKRKRVNDFNSSLW